MAPMTLLSAVARSWWMFTMVLFPGAGALAVVWLIGLQALIAGILLIALG